MRLSLWHWMRQLESAWEERPYSPWPGWECQSSGGKYPGQLWLFVPWSLDGGVGRYCGSGQRQSLHTGRARVEDMLHWLPCFLLGWRLTVSFARIALPSGADRLAPERLRGISKIQLEARGIFWICKS